MPVESGRLKNGRLNSLKSVTARSLPTLERWMRLQALQKSVLAMMIPNLDPTTRLSAKWMKLPLTRCQEAAKDGPQLRRWKTSGRPRAAMTGRLQVTQPPVRNRRKPARPTSSSAYTDSDCLSLRVCPCSWLCPRCQRTECRAVQEAAGGREAFTTILPWHLRAVAVANASLQAHGRGAHGCKRCYRGRRCAHVP